MMSNTEINLSADKEINLSADHEAEGIAIIGMAGRFPGARNLEEFWRNLRDGVESITFFSEEELREAQVDATLLEHPDYVRAGATLDDIEMFDAGFFGFNPREAEVLDPQHRLFLEQSWLAIESAGYDCSTYEGLIGVYAGSSLNSYFYRNLYPNHDLGNAIGAFSLIIANDKDHLPTRVSYKLNLRGPSVNVQTSCSTSLVAVHLACQGLLTFQCDIALAGGVSVRVPQRQGYLFQKGDIASPDGHCRAFSARAEGTIGGSGVGVVVLKRLSEALADGDHIHAVIKGSAINNDGSQKVGYTAPSVDGQAEVVLTAQAAGGFEPESVSYIEAHGTGTALGDPIEVSALTQAFHTRTAKRNFCALGSLKTNVGHLDAAAGVAGLIKTVLALRHRMLPASLHFDAPNPAIDFAHSPFYVNDKLAPWPASGTPRRAGVSSFGIGGTNAHVVLEEAPPSEPQASARGWHLLTLSAKTATALEAATTNLIEHLKGNPALDPADVAYTLQVGRQAFGYRRAVVCRDLDDGVSGLEKLAAQGVAASVPEHVRRPVVFMFPGQGAQYVNMGAELYGVEPVFREHVDRCSALLTPLLGLDLRELLFPGDAGTPDAAAQLSQTFVTQPALFVISYAMAKLLMEWGVHPAAMAGHSVGEYVAACLAGVFTLEEALRLVAARGRLIQALPAGTMAAVSLSEKELRARLAPGLSIAAVNAPALCVVSGATAAVDELIAQLAAEGIAAQRLRTSHAFHSEMMSPVLESFSNELKRVNLRAPTIPYVSNLSGGWITAAEARSVDYWVRHLRATVRFAEGVAELLQEPGRIFLEVGPGETLGRMVRQQEESGAQSRALSTLGDARRSGAEVQTLLHGLGRLWLAGAHVDWSKLHRGERRRRLPLPTYPFERQRYWIDAPPRSAPAESRPASSGRRPELADWFYVPSWKRSSAHLLFAGGKGTTRQRKWLVLADETGLGARLAGRLKEDGGHVVVVAAGERFEHSGERAYTVNPRRREDFEELIERLQSEDEAPQFIAHLWGVTPDERVRPGAGSVERCLELGFESLILLAQALEQRGAVDAIKLGVVTSNMQEVTGGDLLWPAKATSLGLCKVMAQEYPHIECRSIDIDIAFPEASARDESPQVEQLIAELSAGDEHRVVAYRHGQRWVQEFEAVRLNQAAAGNRRLREGGTYLITGGWEEPGFAFAEELARSPGAKIVLVGQSDFPPRDEWETWLAAHHEPQHREVGEKIRALLSLESAGAEVLALRADVTSREQMRIALERARERFGDIHGVVHAQETPGLGVIGQKTAQSATSALAPKVQGALVLDELLGDEPLDFFVLCSSTSAILGGFGQSDYAAANAFLDSFAQHRRAAQGAFTVSINWGFRQNDEWRAASAAPASEIQTRIRQIQEDAGSTKEESVEAFRRILGAPFAQVVVSPLDLAALAAQQHDLIATHLSAQQEKLNLHGSLHARPELDEAYVPPANEIEEGIAAIWQKLLGIEQIGINDNFLDLGGHSLLATQVIAQLQDAFAVELPISKLFEEPTIAGLGRVIAATQLEQLEFDGTDDLLDEIESLSLDEIRRELAAELEASSGQGGNADG